MNSSLLQFAAEETAEKTGIAVLGLDPISFVLQLTTFVILFLILKKYAFESIVAVLEQRRKSIDDSVRLGEVLAKEKEKLDEQVDKALQEARKKADKIISDAHHESVEIIKEAQKTAVHEVDTMLADAQSKIIEETQKAQKTLESEMLSMVSEATETILREKLDAKKDDALLRRALSEVSKNV